MGRLGLYAIAGAVILAVISGGYLLIKNQLDTLNETIVYQQEQIGLLEQEKQQLEDSNDSLEKEITRKSDEAAAIREEIAELTRADNESKTRINELEITLRSKEELDRREAIRNSKKASLLLKLINRAIKCEVDNFETIDGKCVAGVWKPNNPQKEIDELVGE